MGEPSRGTQVFGQAITSDMVLKVVLIAGFAFFSWFLKGQSERMDRQAERADRHDEQLIRMQEWKTATEQSTKEWRQTYDTGLREVKSSIDKMNEKLDRLIERGKVSDAHATPHESLLLKLSPDYQARIFNELGLPKFQVPSVQRTE